MKKTPKKKNDKTLFVVAIIVFALAVGLFVGSYARYYTSISVTASTIQSAQWSFTANGQSSTLSMDLLNPGTYGNVYNLVTVENTKKIQPGSSGTYDLILSAEGSDVDVVYTLSFGDIVWSSNPSQPAPGFTWNIHKVEAGVESSTNVYDNATGTITAGDTNTYRINWEWQYDSTEGVGETAPYAGTYNPYANNTLTLSGTIVGYQRNPNA